MAWSVERSVATIELDIIDAIETPVLTAPFRPQTTTIQYFIAASEYDHAIAINFNLI